MTAALPKPADHEERMAAARRRAQYELGDPSWAGLIVGAYLNPAADSAVLAEELADQ